MDKELKIRGRILSDSTISNGGHGWYCIPVSSLLGVSRSNTKSRSGRLDGGLVFDMPKDDPVLVGLWSHASGNCLAWPTPKPTNSCFWSSPHAGAVSIEAGASRACIYFIK